MTQERKRVAVKFGTDCVVNSNGVNEARIYDHAERLAILHQQYDLVVITSGAVAVGERRLGDVNQRPGDRRMSAFLGTAGISGCWERGFERQGIMAGQVLMTHYEMVDAREGVRFRRAMNRAFHHRFVPICNYKDFLSVASDPHDEIGKMDVYKDNDRFGREIAEVLGAEAIIFATHGRDGFEDETGTVVTQFEAGRLANMRAEDYGTSNGGTGGIVGKLGEAAEALNSGMRAFVCNADAYFDQILSGRHVATEVVQG